MLVVLEGTDGAGKDTLARSLATEFGWNSGRSHVTRANILHKGPPDDRHILSQYEWDLLLYRNRIYDPHWAVILNRWHLGEVIYGPLLRGKSLLTEAQLIHIEMLLSALGAIRVVCVAAPEDLHSRWHPGQLITADQCVEVQGEYIRRATELSWRICHPEHQSLLTPRLLEDAQAACREAVQLNDFDDYVGNLAPKAILVGDEVGKPVDGGQWVRHAFTPMKYGAASKLLNGLSTFGIWKNVGMINSDGTDLHGLWKATGCPKMIALGEMAAMRLHNAEVPRVTMPHPAFILRFKQSQWDSYIAEMREEIENA